MLSIFCIIASCATDASHLSIREQCERIWRRAISTNTDGKTSYGVARNAVYAHLNKLTTAELVDFVPQLGQDVRLHVYNDSTLTEDTDKEFLTFIGPVLSDVCIQRADLALVDTLIVQIPMSSMGIAPEYEIAAHLNPNIPMVGVERLYDHYTKHTDAFMKQQIEGGLARGLCCETTGDSISLAMTRLRLRGNAVKLDDSYPRKFVLWQQAVVEPPCGMFAP